MKKRINLDKQLTGIAIGVALPILIFIGIFLFRYYLSSTYQTMGIWNVFKLIATKILSICAIANLLPFYLLLNRNKLIGARGVVLGTMVVGLVVLLLYLLF